MISTDAGLHWSPPISIANFVPVAGCPPEDVCDPDTNQPVRAGTDLPDVAVDPTLGCDLRRLGGRSLLRWDEDRCRSLQVDGRRQEVVDSHQARHGIGNLAGVHARGRGRGQRCGGRHVLRLPEQHGCSWAPDGCLAPNLAGRRGDVGRGSAHGGAFDMESAPFSRGFFLGDYEGLTAIGNDFLAFFATTTGAGANLTDIVSVQATAP